MQRLSRAISEIESYRDALLGAAYHNASEIVSVTLLNAAVAGLMQCQALAPPAMRRSGHNGSGTVATLIRRVNDEIRASAVGDD